MEGNKMRLSALQETVEPRPDNDLAVLLRQSIKAQIKLWDLITQIEDCTEVGWDLINRWVGEGSISADAEGRIREEDLLHFMHLLKQPGGWHHH